MLAQITAEFFVDQSFDDALDLAVAELGFGLSFELRLRHFDADHRRQALAHIFALQILIVLFEQAAADGVAVDGACQRRAKTDQVRAAFDGVDVVGEGEDVLR